MAITQTSGLKVYHAAIRTMARPPTIFSLETAFRAARGSVRLPCQCPVALWHLCRFRSHLEIYFLRPQIGTNTSRVHSIFTGAYLKIGVASIWCWKLLRMGMVER